MTFECPQLDAIITIYDRIKGKVGREEGKTEGKVHLWETAFLVTSRSGKLASAARSLIGQGHWEGTIVLSRTILEDAANLGFICRNGAKAEAWADLYLKSEYLEKHRMIEDAKKGGFVLDFSAEDQAAFEEGYRGYTLAFERLTGRSKPLRDRWNGEEIPATFRLAFGEPCGEYYVGYALHRQHVHANCSAFNRGFHSEWLLLPPEMEQELEQETREQVELSVSYLVAPLVWQALFVEAMMQGNGTETHPGRGEWENLYRSLTS